MGPQPPPIHPDVEQAQQGYGDNCSDSSEANCPPETGEPHDLDLAATSRVAVCPSNTGTMPLLVTTKNTAYDKRRKNSRVLLVPKVIQ